MKVTVNSKGKTYVSTRVGTGTVVTCATLGWAGNVLKQTSQMKRETPTYNSFDDSDYKFHLDKIDTELHRKDSIDNWNVQEKQLKKQEWVEAFDMFRCMLWLFILIGLLVSPILLPLMF